MEVESGQDLSRLERSVKKISSSMENGQGHCSTKGNGIRDIPRKMEMIPKRSLDVNMTPQLHLEYAGAVAPSDDTSESYISSQDEALESAGYFCFV